MPVEESRTKDYKMPVIRHREDIYERRAYAEGVQDGRGLEQANILMLLREADWPETMAKQWKSSIINWVEGCIRKRTVAQQIDDSFEGWADTIQKQAVDDQTYIKRSVEDQLNASLDDPALPFEGELDMERLAKIMSKLSGYNVTVADILDDAVAVPDDEQDVATLLSILDANVKKRQGAGSQEPKPPIDDAPPALPDYTSQEALEQRAKEALERGRDQLDGRVVNTDILAGFVTDDRAPIQEQIEVAGDTATPRVGPDGHILGADDEEDAAPYPPVQEIIVQEENDE